MTLAGAPQAPLLVMGAGAWGTALALSLARRGGDVYLWGRDAVALKRLAENRENVRYLPGIPLPPNVLPCATLENLPRNLATVVLATPLQTTRAMLELASTHGLREFACTAKGIETDSMLLAHEIVSAVLPEARAVAIVSGPSFAREVAEGRPTALAVASRDAEFGRALVGRLHSPTLRPYLTDDVVGVAVGGAVKNVLAIAAGVADGLALGANSRAALITRGLAEMARFGTALGGRPETFMGLAGLGDLVLTCTDDHSRNRRFGVALGNGTVLNEAQRQIGLVEGVPTAAALELRAAASAVDMPICREVARMLRGECSPAAAVRALMNRDLPGHR